MPNRLKTIASTLLLTACIACMASPHSLLLAQATPSAADMVEQLKPQPSAPKTRSLRNLTVEAATNADAPKPSLSLLIQFDFNSAKVKPESHQALLNLAQALQSKELKESKFAVEGHTDAKGRADYNFKLSEQRAHAVSAVLAGHGVEIARLAPVGKGANDPANTADPLAAENRRVRVINLD